MKKQSKKLGKFEIIGAVLSFLVGYTLSQILCSALQVESYALIAVLHFAVVTAFAWVFMRIGRNMDKKSGKKSNDNEEI